MNKTVRILGMANNLGATPPSNGEETWCSNYHKGYNLKLPRVLANNEWTRWFNLHSRKWQQYKYPHGYTWFTKNDGKRPIYFQKVDPNVPGCVAFPKEEIRKFFGDPVGTYFTFSGAWLIALAIMEGFKRIELWGFELRDSKPNEAYTFERPCFFFWVQEARQRGIEVVYQPEIAALPFEPGDPATYAGTLYGFETKPELD